MTALAVQDPAACNTGLILQTRKSSQHTHLRRATTTTSNASVSHATLQYAGVIVASTQPRQAPPQQRMLRAGLARPAAGSSRPPRCRPALHPGRAWPLAACRHGGGAQVGRRLALLQSALAVCCSQCCRQLSCLQAGRRLLLALLLQAEPPPACPFSCPHAAAAAAPGCARAARCPSPARVCLVVSAPRRQALQA